MGAAVATGFLTVGVKRADPAAAHSFAFRILVWPGCAALWPVVLRWWARGRAA